MENTMTQAGTGLLLEELLEEGRASSQEEQKVLRTGISALLEQIVEQHIEVDKIDKPLIDRMMAEIDAKLSRQLDEVMHHPQFQAMESAWRGLKFTVDNTDFRQNIRLDLLNCSKAQLIEDLADATELPRCGLYKQLYTSEYGQYGGEPYAAVIANYTFSQHPEDMELLRKVAAISAMAHAPFIASVGPKMFKIDSFEELVSLGDLKDTFVGADYTQWNSFRETEDARYVGLTAPRFLLRLPYGPDTKPIKAFNYKEDVSPPRVDNPSDRKAMKAAKAVGHEKYLWGNTAFALASRITDSFARYGWCPNIIGPRSGGTVENLPLHQYESMGALETKIPTELLIPDRLDLELSEQGFIALSMRKNGDNACFFSANSVQRPKSYGQSEEGKAAELNYKLGTQLPYVFIVSRLAHYIKVMQREQIGSFKEKNDLERELNKWIMQYVANQDNVQPGVRARKPLREAQVSVTDVAGEPGWYRVSMKVRPHFKYMGADFTLSLVGKLDKK